ncbi:MAG: hypothetical protein KDD40_03000 [Bdellovibrionales bacterium]|nr:hypothetical protein [Bdellovibrionales bacterium]
MAQIMENIQNKIKNSSNGFLLFSFKLISGLTLGLTLALIGQEIFAYSSFLFVFVIVVVTGLFLRKARKWGWVAVMVFDLICALVALLLRMYILIAPGA